MDGNNSDSAVHTTMELHYKATVDNEEWEVSSVEVIGLKKLKDLKRVLIYENEWGDAAKVKFFRAVSNERRPLLLSTKLSKILPGNNEESPLIVIVSLPSQQISRQQQDRENVALRKRVLDQDFKKAFLNSNLTPAHYNGYDENGDANKGHDVLGYANSCALTYEYTTRVRVYMRTRVQAHVYAYAYV